VNPVTFTVDISLNEIIKTFILAGVNGIAVFLSTRYMGKMVERVERETRNGNKLIRNGKRDKGKKREDLG